MILCKRDTKKFTLFYHVLDKEGKDLKTKLNVIEVNACYLNSLVIEPKQDLQEDILLVVHI